MPKIELPMLKKNTPRKKMKSQFLEIYEYIQKNWFWMLIVSGFFYLGMTKNISVHISMQNDVQTASNSLAQPVSLQNKSARTEFSVANPFYSVKNFFTEKSKEKGITKSDTNLKIINPIDKATPKSNRANDFSNISSILATDLSRRYGLTTSEVDNKKQTCLNYIRRFSNVAVAEMNKFGIPASITLAQALLESDAGGSQLAQKNDNHFGIKCFERNCKKGHCANFSDDTHKDFFRKYNNAWESFRAHSHLLKSKRYQHLHLLGTKNYKKWAHGLQKAGYATDQKYADKLINIIEKMELYRYDI